MTELLRAIIEDHPDQPDEYYQEVFKDRFNLQPHQFKRTLAAVNKTKTAALTGGKAGTPIRASERRKSSSPESERNGDDKTASVSRKRVAAKGVESAPPAAVAPNGKEPSGKSARNLERGEDKTTSVVTAAQPVPVDPQQEEAFSPPQFQILVGNESNNNPAKGGGGGSGDSQEPDRPEPAKEVSAAVKDPKGDVELLEQRTDDTDEDEDEVMEVDQEGQSIKAAAQEDEVASPQTAAPEPPQPVIEHAEPTDQPGIKGQAVGQPAPLQEEAATVGLQTQTTAVADPSYEAAAAHEAALKKAAADHGTDQSALYEAATAPTPPPANYQAETVAHAHQQSELPAYHQQDIPEYHQNQANGSSHTSHYPTNGYYQAAVRACAVKEAQEVKGATNHPTVAKQLMNIPVRVEFYGAGGVKAEVGKMVFGPSGFYAVSAHDGQSVVYSLPKNGSDQSGCHCSKQFEFNCGQLTN